jgi:hypothetical protein
MVEKGESESQGQIRVEQSRCCLIFNNLERIKTFAFFADCTHVLRGCLTYDREVPYGWQMPSPVGHALGGALVALGLLPKPDRQLVRDLGFCALIACLPDIDFLWGRHAMETHSVGAATIAGIAVFLVTRRPRLAVVAAVAWFSHVVFDWLGSDDFPPIGVMALWPLTNRFYFADAFLFEAISRRYHLANFWTHNIMAVVKEIAILAPPTVLLWWVRWRR